MKLTNGNAEPYRERAKKTRYVPVGRRKAFLLPWIRSSVVGAMLFQHMPAPIHRVHSFATTTVKTYRFH